MTSREPSKSRGISAHQLGSDGTFNESDTLPERPLRAHLLDERDRIFLIERFSDSRIRSPFDGTFDYERMAYVAEVLSLRFQSLNPDQGELKFSACVYFPDPEDQASSPELQIEVSPAHFDGPDRSLVSIDAKLINCFSHQELPGQHLDYGPIEIPGIEPEAIYQLHLL